MTPDPGTVWRLVERVGQAAADIDTSKPFTVAPIPAGTRVTVREVVPADVAGAHTADEDAVVVEFDEPAILDGPDGVKEYGTVRRAWACSLPDFERLFEAVS